MSLSFIDAFGQLARQIARAAGHPITFVIALLVILIWALTGPAFQYSDTWQLVINTGTTIITFLMVFLIQNTQNRDATAMHLKLDELIRAVKGAQNRLVDLEDLTEEELENLRQKYARFAEQARAMVDKRGEEKDRATKGKGRS
jgi:low affinity Fe/Cu permease